MSAFVRTTNDDELRLRLGQAFSAGQLLTGTALNPANIVLFDVASTGPVLTLITQIRIYGAVANSWTLFRVNIDPALALGNTPSNRNGSAPGGSTCKWEAAVAALAITNILQAGQIAIGTQQALLGPDTIALEQSQGLVVQFPALAGNVFVSMSWYELGA